MVSIEETDSYGHSASNREAATTLSSFSVAENLDAVPIGVAVEAAGGCVTNVAVRLDGVTSAAA